MNCPSCKSPNPSGVAYCQMCYESFNRSAADTYMRAMRREKYTEHKKIKDNDSLAQLLEAVQRFFREMDYAGLGAFLLTLLRGRRALMAAGVAMGLIFLLLFISHWSGLRYSVLGRSMRYTSTPGMSSHYLVGFQNKLKTWSERDGALDSPLDEFQTDDIGNVMVERSRSGAYASLGISPYEWIAVQKTGDINDSHTVALKDPSLAPQSVTLDANGFVTHRPSPTTLRLGRALGFLVPVFPHAPLRLNRQWTEPAQWVEHMGDWKIEWSGKLIWTLEGEAPCGDDTCAHLTYLARVSPKIIGVPDWAHGATSTPAYHGSGHGDALFDPKRGYLVANNYVYEGLFRVPLNNLGRIPIELRVGRRVEGLPGDILIQFQNRIDIRATSRNPSV